MNEGIRQERKRRAALRRRLRAAIVFGIMGMLAGCGLMLIVLGTPKARADDEETPSIALQTPDMTPAPETTETPEAVETPDVAEDNGLLTLVNAWNAVPSGFSVKLTELKNGQAVAEACYPDLQKMMDDCRLAGFEPLICSSYRSAGAQSTLYENKVSELMASGLSRTDAELAAVRSVAAPGTSEHQLGLAVDIVDINYQVLDEAQEATAVQQWLLENCWSYGFIHRYPDDKCGVTGVMYEPWHYRYVGREAAKAIHDRGICLEEYVEGQS